MNRHLKERVIGAVVLVALAVLVVPEFLTGRDDTSTVNVDLALPATPNSEVRTHSFRLDEPSETPSAPVPLSTNADAQAVEEGTRAALDEARAVREESERAQSPEPRESRISEASPAPAETSAAESSVTQSQSGAGSAGWAVQLGSFSSEENAQRLVASLQEKGYEAFIARFESGGRTLHRVRIGPATSREDAQALARRLAAHGQNGRVVTQP